MLVLAETNTHAHTHGHTHIQLKHCITIQSSEENSYVFTFLYNIHCTRSEDAQGLARLVPAEYESAKLQVSVQCSAK